MQPDSHSLDEAVTAANVDLSNCDRELIHAPGLIQPHGVMLVLRPADLAIVQASENTATVFGVSASDLTMKGLAYLLGPDQAAAVAAALTRAGHRLDSGPLQILPQLPPAPGREALDVIAHRAGDVLIVELERTNGDRPRPINLYSALLTCIARLQTTASLKDFLDLAVAQVRSFTGFDRVMAYQFAEDGSGFVAAEARRDDLNGYVGMHFPASDIPAPARRLFALSWLLHLPDVNYTPVGLMPEIGPPVDMSRALLRHVSVMYSSYLKNMSVHSTMVLPLMKAGRLWGLISCMHHAAPLHVPCRTRTAIETLAHVVSLTMAEQEDRDTAAYRLRMTEAIAALNRQMAADPVYHRGLCNGSVTLHGWLDAAGAALVTEDGIVLLGTTPSLAEVSGIAAWFAGHADQAAVFASDRLPEVYPSATAFKIVASGLLAVRLMRSRKEFAMWFRPELTAQTVDWAGDPHKPVQVDVVDGESRLTPRASFELWRETVHGRSAPWEECELEAAAALRQAIAEIALVRMNGDLERSNTELDSFAYVASHDLKEPLRGINTFTTFLKLSADAKLTEEERGRIETIIRLTRRMDDLTDALLQYSRAGRAEVTIEAVDLNTALRRAMEALEPLLIEAVVVVRVPRPLPAAQTDRIRFAEVIINLITNAVQYNDRPAGERTVEVGWQTDSGRPVFHVRDNGIGIAAKHLDEVFQIFRRLHARDEYGGGYGAGLTIARRTVERLGGHIWVESEGPGKGSAFFFTLGGAITEGAQP
jgi:light-regulated signal transduction histidine kinase (bacteriophytochrome)